MNPQILLDCTFERTLDQVRKQLLNSTPRPERVQLWLFEDTAARQALTEALASEGIEAQVHSAYKPLVHFFLDDVDKDGLIAVDIVYPVLAECTPTRFLLEAYPLAEMLAHVALHFRPGPYTATEDNTHACYQVTLHYEDGSREQSVFAPNRPSQDILGQTTLIPSAWLMIRHDGEWTHQPLESAYLQCYTAVMQAVAAHPWPVDEPYFDRLVIRADLPGIERELSVGHETISTTEAMHEDIYFSLLEFFQQHSDRPLGNRGLQPGQIIPDIRLSQTGDATLRVHYEPATGPRDDRTMSTRPMVASDEIMPSLATVGKPLTDEQIQAACKQIQGEHFMFTSCRNRPVHGVHVPGHKPAVLISGGQHANETTGIVGALRAVRTLHREAGAHLVLMPLENPDGYALHQALCRHNPKHMHHAARYSALGDDIEYREHPPWFERRARHHAFEISGARLHVNLHGYPAHEWTRPCTGYLPRGFEIWSIPKGFFLILRYHADAQAKARALLAHVTKTLAENKMLMEYNSRQLETYRQHANDIPFPIMNGIPYMEATVENMPCDVTLVTEYPDETIYDNDFVLGHTVQMETVMAATRWWWQQGT